MVFQVNYWVCEVCGRTATVAHATSPYSDPVVAPPKGEEWGYVKKPDKPRYQELHACPTCLAAYPDGIKP